MGGRLSTAGLLQMATADDQKVNRAVARWRLLLEQFHRLQQILGPFFLLKFAREEEAEGALRDPPALAQGLAAAVVAEEVVAADAVAEVAEKINPTDSDNAT